ncbi:osteoclast stimulatory transmembrane protein [Latimeria chalumnae]|uniref:osteoclast stimulatory transmembrane protein n=1 Tax=Latimeria chalumnae TaxID=7897 RepID=UPI0003C14674|nr:PREDICTED: osteoclast stimulatory transmembrane protein [Latimeria chalumnae]|eukprot:XP_005986829.1 PREDICTED: osteoclast stimulatory transmembrane protein [Latimeria chalumnae]
MFTGCLLYNWMLSPLQYTFQLSLLTAIINSILFFLLLVLVHPVRCMLTIIIPTLGTKQGRRLLLSTCFMIVAFNIIPNIVENVKTINVILKCSSQISSEGIVNSTILLKEATTDLGCEINTVLKTIGDFSPRRSLTNLDVVADINVSASRKILLLASQKIKNDFSAVEMIIKENILLANRVIAGFFFFYLLGESLWYLKNYLSNLKYDNIYITKNLEDLAQKNNTVDILSSCSRKIIKSMGLKMSHQEVLGCLFRMLLISIYLFLTLIIIATDHILFYVIRTIADWVFDFPTVPMDVTVNYNVKVVSFPIPLKEAVSFQKDYHWNFPFFTGCTMKASPPNNSVAFVIGLLYLIAYIMVFLEAYASRLRRKIAASFFEHQECQRVDYLYQKIIQKYKEAAETHGKKAC